MVDWRNVNKLSCPNSKCRSVRLVHDGFIRKKNRKCQRYLCMRCGIHTIAPKGGKGK